MKQSVESLGRIRLQGVALLAVTLVVGVLAGMAGERYRATRREPPRPFPPAVGELPAPYRQLDLSDDQRARILEILERRHASTDSVLREVVPKLRAVTDSVQQEIRAVLTPEQRAKLDEEFGGFVPPALGPGVPGGPPGPGGPGRPPGRTRGPPPGRR
jgi:Spy/CpxP family protein refolding chaperone